MSHPSRKQADIQLPSLDSQLNEQQQEKLAEAIGNATLLSGAAELPPAHMVPDGGVGEYPVPVAPPIEREPDMATALLSVADVMGTMPKGSYLGQLAQEVRVAQQNANRAPINTAAAQIVFDGRKVTIPETVRDVPNFLHVNEPLQAQRLYNYFLELLTKEEFNSVLDLAQRGVGPKPLMWFSEKIFFTLQVERWAPLKDSASEPFNVEDARAGSIGYNSLCEAFGYDNAALIANTAERLNIGVRPLLRLIALHLLERHELELYKNKTQGTITDWKR